MEEFKQREIYERIYREEARDRTFHTFFTSLDNTKSAQVLYLSSVGIQATLRKFEMDKLWAATDKTDVEDVASQDEGGAVNEED